MTGSVRRSDRIRTIFFLLTVCTPITAFSGTSDPTGLGRALVVAIFLVPLVVLVCLGAALGRSKGALSGLSIYLVGLGAFWFSASMDERGRHERGAQREEAISICKTELPDVLPEYLVDSLLLDAGVVEGPKLKRLLGEQGLSFVEIRAKNVQDPTGGVTRWGIGIVDGDSSSTYVVPKNFQYVRFSLATIDDPQCEKQWILGFRLNTSSAPFSPDACVRAELVHQADASHVIKAQQKTSDAKFSQWAFIEQRTGKTLIALTSSDKPDSPIRQQTSNRADTKTAKFGEVSCRQPYFSIVDALRANPNNKLPRLSLQRRVIQPRVPGSSDIISSWQDIAAKEIPIPDWGKKDSQYRIPSPWGPDWVTAFQLAQESGAAPIADQWIDYQSGALISLRTPKHGGEWMRGYTAASKDGFVFVATYTNISSSGAPLLRYSLDGELVWHGVINPEHTADDSLGKFDPLGVVWEADALLIFGFRHNKAENRSQVSMLRVPNAAIGLVN